MFDKTSKKLYKDRTIPLGVRSFFKCIGSESAVCSYLPPTLKNMDLIDDLFAGIRGNPLKMKQLHHELPIFYNLLKDLKMDIPDVFKAIVLHLKDIAGKPFDIPVKEKRHTQESSLSWYLSLFSLLYLGLYLNSTSYEFNLLVLRYLVNTFKVIVQKIVTFC